MYLVKGKVSSSIAIQNHPDSLTVYWSTYRARMLNALSKNWTAVTFVDNPFVLPWTAK